METKIIEPVCLNSKVDGKQPSLSDRIYSCEGIATAVTTGFMPNTIDRDMKIRKLTPRECFRLMDFDDDDFDKVKAAGISDSQCYKQAGNSIVVAVLEAIFKQML